MKRVYTYLDPTQTKLIDTGAKVLGVSRADFLRMAALHVAAIHVPHEKWDEITEESLREKRGEKKND